MAELILGWLCIVVGVACAAIALLVLWGTALEQAATGSSDNGRFAFVLALAAVAGVGGGILILVL